MFGNGMPPCGDRRRPTASKVEAYQTLGKSRVSRYKKVRYPEKGILFRRRRNARTQPVRNLLGVDFVVLRLRAVNRLHNTVQDRAQTLCPHPRQHRGANATG